jgi:hypothetical protein
MKGGTMYYCDEYNFHLSPEQVLMRSRYEDPEGFEPGTSGEDLKRDLPVYLLLLVFEALMAALGLWLGSVAGTMFPG